MAVHYRTKGFVFDKSERGEADRIFNVFSNDFGRLEIYGKAIRKINSKLKSGIDLFCLSEIEFIEGKNRKTLTDATVSAKFENILNNLNKIKVAGKISDVLNNFIKGQQKDENTFNLLRETFNRLDNAPAENFKPDILYYYFLWNFLAGQGYSPQVSKCACCGLKLNPYGIYFSCMEGGIICKKCLKPGGEAQKINSDIVKILRIILNKDWETASKLKIGPLSKEILKKVSGAAVKNFCPG